MHRQDDFIITKYDGIDVIDITLDSNKRDFTDRSYVLEYNAIDNILVLDEDEIVEYIIDEDTIDSDTIEITNEDEE